MDKLTWYDEDGRLYCRRGYEVALARLASYEATELMPDEIVKMGMMFEDSKRYSGRLELKLMPYLNIGLSPDELKALMLASAGTHVAEIKAFDGIAIDRLCDLAEADRDGRVVVLPCKVGDTVYLLFAGNPNNPVISTLKINTVAEAVKLIGKMGMHKYIGTFRTREEAEKALEAIQNE